MLINKYDFDSLIKQLDEIRNDIIDIAHENDNVLDMEVFDEMSESQLEQVDEILEYYTPLYYDLLKKCHDNIYQTENILVKLEELIPVGKRTLTKTINKINRIK